MRNISANNNIFNNTKFCHSKCHGVILYPGIITFFELERKDWQPKKNYIHILAIPGLRQTYMYTALIEFYVPLYMIIFIKTKEIY